MVSNHKGKPYTRQTVLSKIRNVFRKGDYTVKVNSDGDVEESFPGGMTKRIKQYERITIDNFVIRTKNGPYVGKIVIDSKLVDPYAPVYMNDEINNSFTHKKYLEDMLTAKLPSYEKKSKKDIRKKNLDLSEDIKHTVNPAYRRIMGHAVQEALFVPYGNQPSRIRLDNLISRSSLLRKKVSEREKNLAELKLKETDANEKLSDAYKRAADEYKKSKELQKKNIGLVNKFNKNKKAVRNLETKQAELTEEKAKLETILSEEKERLEGVLSDYKEKSEELPRLEKELYKFEERKNVVEKELTEIKSEVERVSEELDSYKNFYVAPSSLGKSEKEQILHCARTKAALVIEENPEYNKNGDAAYWMKVITEQIVEGIDIANKDPQIEGPLSVYQVMDLVPQDRVKRIMEEEKGQNPLSKVRW